MIKTTSPKDPQATLDYDVDWTKWLGSMGDVDAINSSSFAAEAGLTVSSDTHDGRVAKVWLTGGAVGRDYRVTNHIVTTSGRVNDYSFIVPVRQR